ncbi:MAG: carbon-nitrogen hydrolase family protein [Bacteriovoracaceae bacterium]|nr:carbon-nitrogen hydrolase family protein [Bacteriovoracaceae bacterium]
MKIGVIQITSGLEYEENLIKIRKFIDEAKSAGCEAVFLPECFYSLSDGTKSTPYVVNGVDDHYKNIQNLALDNKIYVLGGTAAAYGGGEVKNRAYNFDPSGKDLGTYDKIHLFSCELKDKVIDENDIYSPGEDPKMITAGPLKIGLGICFDLRYPEMYRDYSRKGANLITASSAFTVPTGKAHWHTLIKARAIENQCYVVAAAQWGKNNERISTYGHSLVVDPWGEVLADAEEGEKLITAELDLDYVQEVRKKVKVF